MTTVKYLIVIKSIYRFFKLKASLVLVAFMLGMSNVILEENRMVNDTRPKIEVQEIQPDDDPLSTQLF